MYFSNIIHVYLKFDPINYCNMVLYYMHDTANDIIQDEPPYFNTILCQFSLKFLLTHYIMFRVIQLMFSSF